MIQFYKNGRGISTYLGTLDKAAINKINPKLGLLNI
jgi:hypothetical protein